jgi:hypothetical protein
MVKSKTSRMHHLAAVVQRGLEQHQRLDTLFPAAMRPLAAQRIKLQRQRLAVDDRARVGDEGPDAHAILYRVFHTPAPSV